MKIPTPQPRKIPTCNPNPTTTIPCPPDQHRARKGLNRESTVARTIPGYELATTPLGGICAHRACQAAPSSAPSANMLRSWVRPSGVPEDVAPAVEGGNRSRIKVGEWSCDDCFASRGE
ncbi:hypothetical protein M758_2G034300 [Ceratodon purpureus]|uniref:Uncharacterized protein n=1 Tax=Ceratodon purpureus TaxID=3225 RepID=A0A8T0IRU6_CERPU|nr:hypothetical protein KC19_2G035300 [Ceratodon purpureus]KAG0625183.1 hypothetical protein M758_2G034300 [Ceratodon purpureus]